MSFKGIVSSAFACLFVALFVGLMPVSADAAPARTRSVVSPSEAFVSSAEAYALPVPEKVGSFQHPVIYASPEVRVQKVSRSLSKVLQRLVVQWGLHVFEVGDAVYECTTVADCEYVDFIRRATYESCKVKDDKLTCSKKLSGEGGPTGNSSDPTVRDTFNVEPERPRSSENDEFPERTHDPDWPMP